MLFVLQPLLAEQSFSITALDQQPRLAEQRVWNTTSILLQPLLAEQTFGTTPLFLQPLLAPLSLQYYFSLSTNRFSLGRKFESCNNFFLGGLLEYYFKQRFQST